MSLQRFLQGINLSTAAWDDCFCIPAIITVVTHIWITRKTVLIGLVIAIVSMLIRLPVLTSGLNPVDDGYLINVPQILSGYSLESIVAIFAPGNHVDYYPIRDLSYKLDYVLFGGDWTYYHAHQLLLFGELVLLVFLILCALGVPVGLGAPIVAAWAFNPFHTETLAWLSARKDILALVFGAYSVLFFIIGTRRYSKRLLGLAVGSFALCLFSKASFVFLPLLGVAYLATVSKQCRLLPRPYILGAMALAGVYGIFTIWFYTKISPAMANHDFNFRLQASAASFSRMLAGWFDSQVNVLEVWNTTSWLSDNVQFITPGYILWAFFILSFIYALKSQSRALSLTLVAFGLLYIPICGLIFSHHGFYSTRYFEPSSLALYIGVGYMLSAVTAKSGDLPRSWLRLGFGFLAVFSIAPAWSDAELWQDPQAVIEKSAQIQPHSIGLHMIRYQSLSAAATQAGASQTAISAADELRTWLSKECQPRPAVDLNCFFFWFNISNSVTRFSPSQNILLENARQVLRLSWGDTIAARTNDIVLSIIQGDLNRSTLQAWANEIQETPAPEVRLLSWVAKCVLEGPAAARILLSSFLDSKLLTLEKLRSYLDGSVAPGLRGTLDACT